MFRNKRLIVALLLITSLFATLPAVSAQEEERTVLNINWGTEPPTLDPSHATDTTSLTIIEEIGVGLGRQHELTVETEPGMATWTTEETEEGLIFTFAIRDDIPWVKFNAETGEVEQVLDENGEVRIVNAHDFAYALLRTLDPLTAGEYAYVLVDAVKAAADYNGANPDELSAEELQALRDAVGITLIDDFTLQVETPSKAAFMDDIIAGMWFGIAQPQWLIEEYGDFWTEPENIQSYGAYALKEWFHDDSLTVIANPFWPGTDNIPQPAIPEIYGVMLSETSTAFANYEAGTLDVTEAPLGEMDRIRADPVLSEELFIAPIYCSYYYGFNVEQPPMDNVHLRRAFSYAVDRQGLIDNVTKSEQEPAQWFARPGLLAAPTMEDSPDLGIGYDPEKAQEELALALDEMGLADVSELPPITLMTNDLEGNIRIAEAIQQMWITELNIEVQMAIQEWKAYLQGLRIHSPHVYRLGWCQDYPDASNFDRDVFRSDSDNNHTNFANEEYDRLVDEAMVETDTAKRLELYRQTEQILTYEDAAIIPIYWYTTVSVTKPYVNRTYSLTGHQRYEKWSFGG